MKIYRMDPDINRYRGFAYPTAGTCAEFERLMRKDRPIAHKWRQPEGLQMIPGKKGDFTSSPLVTARLALNGRAVSMVGKHLEHGYEFLPLTYRNDELWILYIVTPTDCLDPDSTTFHGNEVDPNEIARASFVASQLPSRHVFRVVGGYDYFVTDEFKEVIEAHGLLGAKFTLIWTDENDTGDAPAGAGTSAPASHSSYRLKPGRISKRERLLLRLWREVINSRGTQQWLQDELTATSDGQDDHFRFLTDPSEILSKAEAAGMSRDELSRLARGMAYQIVFEALVAIEEECALKAPFAGLHEDLLMAGFDPRADAEQQDLD